MIGKVLKLFVIINDIRLNSLCISILKYQNVLNAWPLREIMKQFSGQEEAHSVRLYSV